MTDAATASAMQTLLSSVTQALPTNGAQPLVASGAVPLPTTPASALQVVQSQILPVINPNAYKSAPPAPWYKKPATWGMAAAGLGALALLVLVARKKKRK